VGIGRAFSTRLVAEGARVMIADIADGAALAAELGATHGANSIASSITDISDEAQVKSLVAKTVERFGKIDVLVNNAAYFSTLKEQKFQDIDVELWDRVIAVNLRGTFLMNKHVVPQMIAQKYGKIVNIGSGTPYHGVPWNLHYVTSKGGIVAMSRAMSRELGDYGIRVNTLSPGFTLSDTNVKNNADHIGKVRERNAVMRALKRDEYPDDLTGTLVFLASAESDFITGQNIAVDGGASNL
jgi:NAD(P)-dependent dehydrogenase (short-subunit alcohol dehydrogenase family)